VRIVATGRGAKRNEQVWPKGEWQLWNKPAQEAAVRTASASDRS
jgi:hypothetical protein